MTYASETSVSSDKSRSEIERILVRYGADQFMASVTVDDAGCWNWTGKLHDAGYGRIRLNGKNVYTHRLSYAAFVGAIPEGWTIDHLCRNRVCCNPSHLEAVTRGENVLRGMNARVAAGRAGTCVKGHAMSGLNLYTSPKGQTHCRSCRRVRHREQARRRREAA